MNRHIPSIFNDVVGPVMRGPSSSHSAAALRIGRLCRDLAGGKARKVVVSYSQNDALATTHESQGSDMGLKGGILGYEADDSRLLDAEAQLEQSGIDVLFQVKDTGKNIANLYQLELSGGEENFQVEAVSTGGGMIRILSINGTEVNMEGDSYEILIWSSEKKLLEEIARSASWADESLVHQVPEPFLALRSRRAPDQEWQTKIRQKPDIRLLRVLHPVLPVLSQKEGTVPFRNCQDLLVFNEKENLKPWEMALAYEAARGGIRPEEAWRMMEERYTVMRNAVEEGLKGTSYHDRLLPSQSPAYQEQMEKGKLSKDDALHKIILYVTALMEVKSSMGVIVAAPTAGSCGTFPGAVLGLADSLDSSTDETVKALLTGSLVGLFIAGASTFSAEIGGCQAECGAGAGMAAAALVYLLGGSLEQSMAAASMALQNSLGMICDPIAARVEAPCLGKNVSSAVNALSCANMLMAGYKELIPLDEVIETMDRVGRSLPFELRCTALGGLSVTSSAKKLEKRLKK